MFTSDRGRNTEGLAVTADGYGKKEMRSALIYLMISLVLAAAGAVYEHFSFGVYSNYMIYAFAIPLIGGTLPYLLISLSRQRSEASAEGISRSGNRSLRTAADLTKSWLYHAALATLTVGSIMKGALDICGRPNGLTIGYPIAAALLLAAAVYATIRAGSSSPGEAPDTPDADGYKPENAGTIQPQS